MTELILSTNQRGTLNLSEGLTTVTGNNTAFTQDDVGKKIKIRDSATELNFTIVTVTNLSTIEISSASPITKSNLYYYLNYQNVDLYDDFPFTLTMSIADIRNPEKRNTAYSKTITIPATKTNNNVMSYIYEIDSTQGFNPNIRAFAELYIDSVLQFRGVAQLLRIKKTREKIEYEINLFGMTANVLFAGNSVKLNEIDFSDLEHSITIANIVASWSAPVGVGYVYPLIDNDSIVASGLVVQADINKQLPCIYAKEFVDRIFEQSGNTYESTFLESELFKRLIIPTQKSSLTTRLRLQSIARIKFVGAVGGINVTVRLVRYNVTMASIMVLDSQTYSSPQNANQTFSLIFDTITNFNGGDQFYLDVIHDSTVATVTQESTSNFEGSFVYDNSGIFFANDFTGTRTSQSSAIPYNTLTSMTYTTEVDPDNRLDIATGVYTMRNISYYYLLPNQYTCTDFLLSIFKMFNLYAMVDVNDEKNIIIEPRDDFYNNVVVNWDAKLDIDRAIEILPMGELNFQQFLLTYKPDTDYYNRTYTSVWTETYGQRLNIIDNDFVKNVNTNQLIFSPTPSVGSVVNEFVFPNISKENPLLVTQDNGVDKPNIRILY